MGKYFSKKLDIDTSGINLASTDLDYADISDDKNAVQIEAAHKYVCFRRKVTARMCHVLTHRKR